MAQIGFFKSPTGKAVTWDETGKHTDTGIDFDTYKLPAVQAGGPTFGGGTAAPKPAATQPAGLVAGAQGNYFISPSTGNMVTWDETGKHTDTGQKAGLAQDLQGRSDYSGLQGTANYAPDQKGATSGFFNTTNEGSNRGDGSVWNHISDMPADTYQSYLTKMGAMKTNELGAWLQGGAAPMSEADWNAQRARAGSGPTSFGGGVNKTKVDASAMQGSQNQTTSGGGGLVSSSMGPKAASVQNWDVTAPQTVNHQVANIVAQDGPLMQQARARALMDANERGLVNSSMAVGNAQSAVLDKAIEIGARDATTNAQAAQFNANAGNQNSMFNSGQTNQWNTNSLDRADRASEREKDRAAAIAAAGFDAQTRKDLAALEQTYRTQLNSDQGFDRQFAQYADTLLRIDTDPNLDAEAKTRLKESARSSLQSYATIRKLNLDLNFGAPA